MVCITNITVKYGRTTKPADYEAKRADVELSGIVDEGEDAAAAVDRLSTLAIGKTHELLGLAKPAPATLAKAAAQVAQAAPTQTKADLEAAAKAAASPPAEKPKRQPPKPPATKPAEPKPDPAAVDDAAVVDPEPAADDLSDLTGDAPEPAREIKDEEIVSAITKKNQALKDAGATNGAVLIRNLIAEFIAPPGNARQIEQVKRQSFLSKLEALKHA